MLRYLKIAVVQSAIGLPPQSGPDATPRGARGYPGGLSAYPACEGGGRNGRICGQCRRTGGNLAAVRDDLCQDAATMPDSEVKAIAAWTWRARLENRIFRGRDSAVSLNRLALDALRQWHNEADAIALFVLLQDMHGHTPGKRFALDFRAMRDAGLTSLSIPRLRAARRTLEAVGLVRLVGNYRAGSVHQTFTLARLRVPSGDGAGFLHIREPG